MNHFTETLTRGISDLGLCLSAETLSSFEAYYNHLIEQNRVMNLTAITGEADAARLHFLDSLALLDICDFKNARVIDIGSGAGFPGLPLKLAEPSIRLTLLDSTQKRVSFLSGLCGILGLGGVTCLHSRAEESAHSPAMRGSFDFALSRAVARLDVLCELCLPFVILGGIFIAMKSVDSADEELSAANAIITLGGEIVKNVDYQIPGTNIAHRAVLIRKTSDTPVRYPRRFSKIQNSPL